MLSKSDLVYEEKFICVLSVIDEISPMIIDEDVEFIGREKFNLTVDLLQRFCLKD